MSCNDSDPCTTDSCVGGGCQNIQNDPCCGVNCEDFDQCTVDCCVSGYCAYDRPAQDCSLFLANTTVAVCPGGTRTVPGSVTNQGQCPETFQWTTPLIVYSGQATGWITSVTAVPAPIGLPGGGFTAISVIISVAADAPAQAMAEVTLQLTSQPDGQACGPLPSQECQLTFTVVVGQVNLDVDSNNDGQIADADDPIEEGGQEPPFTPTTAGKFGWPNHDDSDNNGIRDNEGADADHVNGQTDLQDIGQLIVRRIDPGLAADPRVYITAGNPALVRLFQGYSGNAIAFDWEGPGANRADLNTFIQTLNQQDMTFGMEGLASGTTLLTLELRDGDVLVCEDKVRITVITLEVSWRSTDPMSLPITENRYYLSDPVGAPPIDPATDQVLLGLNYHPDATLEDGNWNESIYVRVETTPRINDVAIYMRALDPDDPSANSPGNALDTDAISGLAGDNRDRTARLTSRHLTTGFIDGTDGAVRNTFRVSHQPGDNHRVAASLKESSLYPVESSVLNNDNIHPSGAPVPAQDGQETQMATFIGHISPLLTIWRILHIELDSMNQVSWTANSQQGTIQAQPEFNPATQRAWITIEDLDSEFEAVDQHRTGRIDIAGYGAFLTLRTEVQNGNDRVEIQNAPAGIVNAEGQQYTLWDDDKGSQYEPDFIMEPDYPPVVLPHLLDDDLMNRVYAPAYVDVEFAGFEHFDYDTPFDHQVHNVAECKQLANTNRDLNSSPTFWVVHLTAAYQGWIPKDGDPDTEKTDLGLQFGLTVETSGHSSGSLVYLETIRDQYAPGYQNIVYLEQFTVAHESGHQFLIQHEDDHWPPGEDPPAFPGDYIMSDQFNPGTGYPPNLTFSPTSLKKIRQIPYPPQP